MKSLYQVTNKEVHTRKEIPVSIDSIRKSSYMNQKDGLCHIRMQERSCIKNQQMLISSSSINFYPEQPNSVPHAPTPGKLI